ncbi:1-aminocyclopropane-1-carboxylate deaminase/D-cysteine desulfhydrase [Christiangramia salexigens]|uniref:1-aminocyclopropane-1-carboxylate deaminase n=1 Tax=Christiangramia salexigens TaxID=1913577 RepID=A0A1L3J5D1_9FLAO|nr:pyridoxal-phosphate dependent enzyme [Christiangramia salexigens]APG60348.1 1-aminocyclopropane-1-carboxylate deaminase [Christiangramia salexigens]
MQDFLDDQTDLHSQNQFVDEFSGGIKLWIKREDLLHPEVSGNKFRKLKYNLLKAREERYDTLLTFGGAFSNHIAATAAAGLKSGFKTIGVIRGDEIPEMPKSRWSPTLKFAESCGMEFHFLSREEYRQRDTKELKEKLHNIFDEFYLVPEGGTNALAIQGCEEILTEADDNFDFICSSVGTGGTLAGLINSLKFGQKCLGFPALKTDYLKDEICKFVNRSEWDLIQNYHFGGYAKINSELVNFMNGFSGEYGIQLDPVYTGKLVFGIFDLIKKGYFPNNSNILAIHTGGLQGIQGMNEFLKKKKLPQIEII